MNNSYKRLLDLVVEGKWGTKDKSGVRKPKPKPPVPPKPVKNS